MRYDQPVDTPEIRLDAAAHRLRSRPGVRRAWGRGFLSGLPFAEVILLACFLMSAGMFLTIDHGDVTTDAAASAPNAHAH